MSEPITVEKFAVGQSVRRVEDPHLLQGLGRYGDDVSLPRQAHAVGGIERDDGRTRERRIVLLLGAIASRQQREDAHEGYGEEPGSPCPASAHRRNLRV